MDIDYSWVWQEGLLLSAFRKKVLNHIVQYEK